MVMVPPGRAAVRAGAPPPARGPRLPHPVLITVRRCWFCIHITHLEASRVRILLSENTAVLIFLRSQAGEAPRMFSAPFQRNLSFTPCFMPYAGSGKDEGFSCQSRSTTGRSPVLRRVAGLRGRHVTSASVSTLAAGGRTRRGLLTGAPTQRSKPWANLFTESGGAAPGGGRQRLWTIAKMEAVGPLRVRICGAPRSAPSTSGRPHPVSPPSPPS